MIRATLLSILLVLFVVDPAFAHKLKVFAAVEGNAISGYGFFIGGGRAQETPWVAKDANGQVIARGTTGADGTFSLTPPGPVTSDITITLNTREGHIASTRLAASRFGAAAGQSAMPTSTVPDAPTTADPSASADKTQPGRPETAALVEAAVQRQVEPLLERIEQMDDRLRFTDILSGIFLIIGLSGIGLWVYGRRNDRH